MTRKLAASLFAGNTKDIDGELRRLAEAGVDTIHFDVMDGKFVNNTALDLDLLAKLDRSAFTVNVHLMVADPEPYIDRALRHRVNAIAFHCEAVDKPTALRLIAKIKARQVKAGIAISPQTAFTDHLEEIAASDFITFMSVTPGFNGQPFILESVPRLAALRQIAGERKLEIEIDGGIRKENIASVAPYVNYYVVGSAIFSPPDMAQAKRDLEGRIAAAVKT